MQRDKTREEATEVSRDPLGSAVLEEQQDRMEFTRAEKKDGLKAGALAEAEEHMWYKLLEEEC